MDELYRAERTLKYYQVDRKHYDGANVYFIRHENYVQDLRQQDQQEGELKDLLVAEELGRNVGQETADPVTDIDQLSCKHD